VVKGKKKVTKPRTNVDDTEGSQPIELMRRTPTKSKAKGKKKSNKVILTIDEALVKGNKFTTKTRDDKVITIYKALEYGLSRTFP